ncbi:LAMI_0H17568g1_1 [Lachancea mirantina]|uniref:LAMI_0H17568g1_1 n=1 Tax=Lachancea mirantina TaxID=1230905 RepID=A0A1G4KJF0_9SACH|nr:LAMI_0H17568g1_1 [Lachancea mirantina]
MIHPLQAVLTTNDGNLVFCVVENNILVFRVGHSGGGDFTLVGRWTDDADKSALIKEKVLKEHSKQVAENNAKRQKTGEAIVSHVKVPKVPQPGKGAPAFYSMIRGLTLSSDELLLFACTDSDKSVITLGIDLQNPTDCLKFLKRQSLPKRPNAISLTSEESIVLVADKFGDVYRVSVDPNVPAVKESEIEPILGHVSLLTDVAYATDKHGRKYVITADRDEHIRVSHYPQCYIIDNMLFGHKTFVTSLCLPQWNPRLLLSGGGDAFICVWDWKEGQLLDSFDFSSLLRPHLNSSHLAPEKFQNEKGDLVEFTVAQIKTFRELNLVVFSIEQSNCIFVCQLDGASGKLAHLQTVKLPSHVIALDCSQSDTFCVTMDSRKSEDNFAEFYTYNNGLFRKSVGKTDAFNKCIVESVVSQNLTVETEEGIYPLYQLKCLRKRGEH